MVSNISYPVKVQIRNGRDLIKLTRTESAKMIYTHPRENILHHHYD